MLAGGLPGFYAYADGTACSREDKLVARRGGDAEPGIRNGYRKAYFALGEHAEL